MTYRIPLFASLALLGATAVAIGYPLDGYETTGIRRLLGYRLAIDKKIQSSVALPAGGFLNSADVKLRLRGINDTFDINSKTPEDAYLKAGLQRIFGGRDPSYSIAILDITHPGSPKYASLKADEKRIPGSVGKLFVATGLFGALKKIRPGSGEERAKFLRDTVIPADSFVHRDGKTVPLYNAGDPTIGRRRVETGDKFNLWEWLDHMMSVSSNAAGSTVWQQAAMMRHFGAKYPPPEAERAAFLKTTPRNELSDLALETLEAPLREAGLDTNKIRLGTFFTRNASSAIPGRGSYATPNELMRWLIKMEQGKLVDEWSSLEIKRLLYFSRPRYRYASSPRLNKAAVFFKSGSLFECEPEPGFTCKQYQGNKTNLMHSVAVVESEGKVYLVTMMSNVLRINSAVEHQTIAGEIEKLIQGRPGN